MVKGNTEGQSIFDKLFRQYIIAGDVSINWVNEVWLWSDI